LGERVNEVDAHGVIKAFVGEQTPKDGEDLSLTLDLSLQIAAEEALKTGLARVHKTRGSVVVSDPRDGSILALVSWPAFDNNAFSGSVSSTLYQNLVHNQDQPLFPRAMAGSYPSGSTVKIVISAAALTEGIITPFTTVLSVGGIRLGAWFFPDWKVGGHGITNVRKAIAQSVNTFFYTIGGGYQGFQGLGADRLSAWMKRFGLGEKTGIDLAAEVSGSVPTRAERERGGGQWYVGDTYNLSIGQGDLLVTPLQVNSYTSIIANGGYRYVPHVVANPHPSFTEVGATDEAYKVVREGMRDCVTGGSCRTVSFLPFPVSAKTGTAQWNSNKETHAWFTAYGSSEHPEVAVTVLVEEGGEGSVASAPVAREVLDAWYRLRQARGGKF
jgi:penicillin-binding protein 2